MNNKLEYFVLNYDFNGKKVVPFNIFDNRRVRENIEEEALKYVKAPKEYTYNDIFGDNKTFKGYDAFKRQVKSIMQSELWARREYEIFVGDAFEEDINKFEKWDCFAQACFNLDLIVDMIIKHYEK